MASGGHEILGSIETIRLYWQRDNVDIVYRTYVKRNQLATCIEHRGNLTTTTRASGDHAWLERADGASLISGPESESYIRRAKMLRPGTWLRNAKNPKVVGLVMVEGKPAYRLNYTTETNIEVDKFFDQDTGLVVRTRTIEHTSGSKQLATRDYLDYRQFGEVLYPATSKITIAGSVTIYQLIDAEFNGELPDEIFEIPNSVQAMIDRPAN